MNNHIKKMAQLKYKDLILQMYSKNIAVSEITKNINFRLSKTKLKTTLWETTIHNIIKNFYKDIK